MALEAQNVDVPFATGLQQKNDPRLQPMGSATTMVNAVIDKLGTIRKRPGTTILTGNAVSANGNGLQTYPGKQRLFRGPVGGLAMLSSHRLWAYDPQKPTWSDIDDVRPVVAKRYGIATPSDSVTSYDVATDGTYAFIVYCEASVVKLAVFNLAQNAVVYGPINADTSNGGDEARVVVTNGKAVIFYQATAGVATIRAISFTISSWAFSASAALVADCGFRGLFDVCAMESGTNMVLAYITNSGANAGNLKVCLVSTTPAVTATAAFAATTGAFGFTQGRGVAVQATTAEQIWVANAFDDGTNTRVIGRGLNTTTLATTTTDGVAWSEVATQYYRIGIVRETSTQCVITGSLFNAPTGYYSSRFSTSGPSGLYQPLRGYGIASKPFLLDSRVCANVVQSTLLSGVTQATYLTVDVLDGYAAGAAAYRPPRPIATIAPRIVTGLQSALYITSAAAQVSTSRYLVVGSVERTASGGTGIDLIDIQAPYNANQTSQVGDAIYIASGTPQVADGSSAVEMGFLHDPRTGAVAATAGAGIAAGTYYYAYVFEYRDDKGQRSQSAPMYLGSATTAAGNLQVTATLGCLHATQRQNTSRTRIVAVAIYRTTIGAGVSGVYYRVWTGAVPALAQSAAEQATVAYIDSASDASIIVNETLDTSRLTPGCPSSLTCMIAHGGRLVGVGDDGVTLWISTVFDGGTTVPYFSDSLVQYMPDGGRVTALASMDGQLVVFRSDGIYVIAGEGPDNSGQQGGFAPPRKLVTDIGCTSDWRSVVNTPLGVVFQNRSKLYVLSRSFEVQYIGAPIEDTLASYPVITSACLHSARDEVRFTVRATEAATTGYVLNWNYVTNAWSVFDYYDSINVAAHAAWEHSCVIDGVWYGAGRTGICTSENTNLTATGAYKDDATWVTLQVGTAWIRPSGAQGFARFREGALAWVQGSPCDVVVSLGYDDSDSYSADTWTFLASDIATWATPKSQGALKWARQKAMSMRILVTDATPTGVSSTTAQGPILYGLTVSLGVKPSINRFPEVQ